MSHIALVEGLVVTDLDSVRRAAETVEGTFEHGPVDVSQFGNNVVENADARVTIPGYRYDVAIRDEAVHHDSWKASQQGRDNFNRFCQETQMNHQVRAVRAAGLKPRKISAPTVNEEGWLESTITL